VEWLIDRDALEAYALPGEGGWVALLLQSRRSLEAQLEQQERWVSDVAHELKTPLTALLLVGESLASQVEGRHSLLVQRLQRELQRLQELVGDLLELSRLENLLPGKTAATKWWNCASWSKRPGPVSGPWRNNARSPWC
jgi:two-component system phosphate regulon sensor histidine kinase PhoR